MQTRFSPESLADPKLRPLEAILRSCVHCGLCTATCPTYVVGGDERDSPRGRIYLIKDLIESQRAMTPEDVAPIDHCLSCLSCMTTCPSGVDYRRLIDHARETIETTYRRPLADRLMRGLLVRLLPSRAAFRVALGLGALAKPFAPLFARLPGLGPSFAAMLALAPRRLPRPDASETPGVFPAPPAKKRRRVGMLVGCAQAVLTPEVNAATVRVLNRAGFDVVVPAGAGCCGSLAHHMGEEARGLAAARATIDAFSREIDGGGLEAIVVNASGCGATVKDYGAMLAGDPAYAARAAKVAALARDVSEILTDAELAFAAPQRLVVAYHAACSLQHGQKIVEPPKALLRRAGYEVRAIPESHLCCGSAGTYNLLQPATAAALKARKLAAIARVRPDVVAAGNVGCIAQIASGSATPVVHIVELVDWASGGPKPAAIR